jgi:hypothetical protein
LLSIITGLWERDKLMKSKPKKIIKPNFQSNTILKDEIRKKNQLKKSQIIKSIRLTCQTYDPGLESRTTE